MANIQNNRANVICVSVTVTVKIKDSLVKTVLSPKDRPINQVKSYVTVTGLEVEAVGKRFFYVRGESWSRAIKTVKAKSPLIASLLKDQ